PGSCKWLKKEKSLNLQRDVHWHSTPWVRVLRKLSLRSLPGLQVLRSTTVEVLNNVVVGGFTFGKITDFEIETCDEGDAFVVAPDNSRAGLVWEVSNKSYFEEIAPPGAERREVWGVPFPNAMTSRENVRKNLESVLPEL